MDDEKQIKVAFLLGSLNRGGMETLLLDVFKARNTSPFSYIGIHRKGGSLEKAFRSCGVPLFRLCPRFPFDPFYLLRLRKTVRKEGVAVVHAQQCLDALYAKIALAGTGIKVCQTFHGYDIGYSAWQKWIVKQSMRMSDGNIFVSESQKQYYQNHYRKFAAVPEFVVYNGIDFSKLDNYSTVKTESEVKSKVFRFGMVGNFVKVRNPLFICKALRQMKESGCSFEFYFVGRRDTSEPWRYDECVAFCEKNDLNDRVHFLGPRDDVPSLLRSWDAFVYASDHDTFGIAVLEAIASGSPVIVNDWEVMKEVTKNGTFAILYETGNEADLLKKVKFFMENERMYKQEAKKKAIEVRTLYSIEKHLQNLKTVYDIISNKHGS